jgi:hypothetical protein
MKYVFWGLITLIVLGTVVVVGGGYWLASMEVDFHDPQTAANFKEEYTANCVATFKQRLQKAKVTPSAEQLTGAEAACACARDPIIEALSKRPKMTVADLATSVGTDPEILGITKTCGEKIGIENPS